MSETLGLFEGQRLDGDIYAFSPARTDLPAEPHLRVDGYALPVTAPASDWYFAQTHTQGQHTGLDINWRRYPRGDVDLGAPVLSTCNGLVLFAGLARGTHWGNLVVTVSLAAGWLLFWRYAHLRDLYVDAGQIVPAETLVGSIGKGYNDRYYAHLHLDCWRGGMIAVESWRAGGVEWLDPLEVWREAGYVWEWGSA